MAERILSLRFSDIVDAIAKVRSILENVPLETFERDWQKRWLIERGILIISEASRHIPDDAKARHPDVPWAKVAAIGNVLRHAYDRIAPDILWKLARDDLQPLAAICREELVAALARERDP